MQRSRGVTIGIGSERQGLVLAIVKERVVTLSRGGTCGKINGYRLGAGLPLTN